MKPKQDAGSIESNELNVDVCFPRREENDFMMVYRCFQDKINYVLLHANQSRELDRADFETLARPLIKDFNLPQDDDIYLILYEDARLINVKAQYITHDIPIEFDGMEALKRDIIKFNRLCDLSPFFLPCSMDSFLKIIKSKFDPDLKNISSRRTLPKLVIDIDSILYHSSDGKVSRIQSISRYFCDDVKAKLKNMLTFKREKIPEKENQSINPNTIETDQTPPKKQSTNKLLDENRNETVTENEIQLINDKYCFHLMKYEENPIKSNLYKIKINDGATMNNIPEPSLSNEFLNPSQLYEKLIQIGSKFFPNDKSYVLRVLVNKLDIQTIGFTMIRNKLLANQIPWSFDFVDLKDQLNPAKKNYEYEKEEQKLKEREQEFESRKKETKVLSSIINDIKTAMQINDKEDSVILFELQNLLNLKNDLVKKLDIFEKALKKVDRKPDNAYKKINAFNAFLSDITSQDNNEMSECGVDEFITQLDKLRKSYDIVKNIHSLKVFQLSSLPAFTRSFGNIEPIISEIVKKLEVSIKSLDMNYIISDAIRSKLSDPEIRKTKILDLEELNKELNLYRLQIDYPNSGDPADPAKHKFVGYDQGGTRGTVSAVISWGLSEKKDNKPQGITVYKAEVKIYQ